MGRVLVGEKESGWAEAVDEKELCLGSILKVELPTLADALDGAV